MGYYINKDGIYYEGDKVDFTDIVVPQRPARVYIWVNNKWVLLSTSTLEIQSV